MTLLERLKPEYLEQLENVNKNYPLMYKKIIKSLESHQSVFALTIDDASSICSFLNMETTVNNLLKLIKE